MVTFTLSPLLQKALDVTLLDVKVVVVDLWPQLDLLDADNGLPLAGFFGLLFLLVPVLAVVHHLADRRVAMGATSTRSRLIFSAYARASLRLTMPTCSPSGPISRTLSARILSLMRTLSAMSPDTSPRGRPGYRLHSFGAALPRKERQPKPPLPEYEDIATRAISIHTYVA